MNKFKAKVEFWDIEKIIPYENNTKIHTPEQITSLAKIINEFGHDVPVVVNASGVIIKGHCRRLACLELNHKKMPVIVRNDLSELQIKASRLSDNRINESEWDETALKVELESLEDFDFDIGFDDFEFSDLELGEDDNNDFSDKNKELDLDDFNDNMELKLKFNKEQFDFVTERLRNINDSLEIALMQVLEYES